MWEPVSKALVQQTGACGLVCCSLLNELMLNQCHTLYQPVPSFWKLPFKQKTRNKVEGTAASNESHFLKHADASLSFLPVSQLL